MPTGSVTRRSSVHFKAINEKTADFLAFKLQLSAQNGQDLSGISALVALKGGIT